MAAADTERGGSGGGSAHPTVSVPAVDTVSGPGAIRGRADPCRRCHTETGNCIRLFPTVRIPNQIVPIQHHITHFRGVASCVRSLLTTASHPARVHSSAFLVCRLPAPVSSLPSPVSRLPSPVSCLPFCPPSSLVSCLPSLVSRLQSPFSRLPSPVSSLLSPVLSAAVPGRCAASNPGGRHQQVASPTINTRRAERPLPRRVHRPELLSRLDSSSPGARQPGPGRAGQGWAGLGRAEMVHQPPSTADVGLERHWYRAPTPGRLSAVLAVPTGLHRAERASRVTCDAARCGVFGATPAVLARVRCRHGSRHRR